MNPDDIATETIMPEAFLDLAREMVAQKSPEAVAMAALAWALRHAPVDGGCTLEISGHRIERIAPEPDPWPTAPLIVATLSSPSRSTKRLLLARNSNGDYVDGVRSALQEIDTLTNVVPVTVVPTAEWEALATEGRRRDPWPSRMILADLAAELVIATDALGLD